jgi:hypothetical protein
MYPGWNVTTYSGDITLYFRKNVSAPSAPPSLASSTYQSTDDTDLHSQSYQGRSLVGKITVSFLLIGIIISSSVLVYILVIKLIRKIHAIGSDKYDSQVDVSNRSNDNSMLENSGSNLENSVTSSVFSMFYGRQPRVGGDDENTETSSVHGSDKRFFDFSFHSTRSTRLARNMNPKAYTPESVKVPQSPTQSTP